MTKQKLLDKIAAEVQACRKCRLYKSAKHGVPGEGNPDAEIFFIGEAPGNREDLTGRPFVGPAGKFLDKLLSDIGIKREDVFIGNIVKHRPPNNRAPKPDEIAACTPYLERQIKIIRPKIIVTLGQYPTQYIFSKAGLEFKTITDARGKIYKAQIFDIPITIIPTFHPAAALYNLKYKTALEEDFVRRGRK